MNNYLMLNNKKIELTDEQVKEIENSFGIGKNRLADIETGDTFKIGKYEFIVLEHSKETTAVILKDLLANSMSFGKNANFADTDCIVRKKLEEFSCELEALVGTKNLVTHTIDLTSDDGLKDYGKTKGKASLLTCNLYRRYVDILDKYKVNSWWWLVTPYSTPTHGYSTLIKCVAPSGNIYRNYYDCNNGVRPFCIFNSNIFVSK